MRERLLLAAASVLVVGLTSAALLYALADEPDDLEMQSIYHSKTYVRQLERFGGKASVLFDDLTRWFEGLWTGRRLAWTVGTLSVVVAGGLFLAARRAGRDPG